MSLPSNVQTMSKLAPARTDNATHSRTRVCVAGVGGLFDKSLMGAYYGWVYRVLHEHRARYGNTKVKVKAAPSSRQASRSRLSAQSVYSKSLAGYYSTDECCLAQVLSRMLLSVLFFFFF